ncbi:MAG: energy-coupling factor transporter transmembrane protein EcfT [Aeromicrobium sp.]|nr:MAG: energy-coupling factor transporter transmembrane protein EcfT [Aeromicrobium sp.]
MSQLNLLGLYQPNATLLHRISPGIKLTTIMVLSIAIVVVREAWFSVVALAVVCGAVGLAQMSWWALFRSIRILAIGLALLAAFHWWQNGPEHAIAVVGGLAALILASAVLTATTPIDQMLDTITRALEPLRRFGVNPDAVGLAFSLLLRFIPDIGERAFEIRDAARARGLDRSVRAHMTPLTIRVVAHALSVGEALQARGIGEDERPGQR